MTSGHVVLSTENLIPAPQVCAVVTTFSPDEQFPTRIKLLANEFQCVIIVDDSGNVTRGDHLKELAGMAKVVLIEHPENRGVAAALNTGIAQAEKLGFLFVLLLDDDSQLVPGAVKLLQMTLIDSPGPHDWIAGIEYSNPNALHDKSTMQSTREVPFIITAGSLLPVDVFRTVGLFREDLFIDYVDIEFCLRARMKGIRILQCFGVGMEQPIGFPQKIVFGLFELKSVHNPDRTYYFFRNSTIVAKEYFRYFPKTALWIMYQQIKTMVKILVFLRPKSSYGRSMMHGWIDSIKRITGKISCKVSVQI